MQSPASPDVSSIISSFAFHHMRQLKRVGKTSFSSFGLGDIPAEEGSFVESSNLAILADLTTSGCVPSEISRLVGIPRLTGRLRSKSRSRDNSTKKEREGEREREREREGGRLPSEINGRYFFEYPVAGNATAGAEKNIARRV